MKFEVHLTDYTPTAPVRVGNVYPVKGGRGASLRHMHVLIAITDPAPYKMTTCCMLTVDKNGNPVGTTQYGLHYVEDLMPIGFVDGLEELTFEIRSLS